MNGQGIALVAISDEPMVNERTKFKVINAGDKKSLLKIKIDTKKPAFILYPVDRSFLVKFNHFKLNSEVEANDSIPFEDDAALFGFEKT